MHRRVAGAVRLGEVVLDQGVECGLALELQASSPDSAFGPSG